MSESPPEKLAPNSPEAECAVLGSLLYKPECFLEIANILTAADFFIVRNAWVWEAIEALSKAEPPQAIDNLTVIEIMRTWKTGTGGYRLDAIGGSAYITGLINATADYEHAETYAYIVRNAAIRRRLLSAAADIATIALQENKPIQQILEHAESTFYGVSHIPQVTQVESAGAIANRYYDTVDQLHQKKADLLGVSTGYATLDKLTSGLQKKSIYIIAACTSMGKTTFALHLAMNGARNHVPALFLSLEMDRDQLINRLIGSSMNLNTQQLQLGDLNDDEWQRFTSGLSMVGRWPLFFDDNPDLSIAQLRTIIRRGIHEARIEVAYIDYLQLLNAPRRDNREQQVSYLARGVKRLAMELDIPIVLCAQLSRKVEERQDKRPQLSDLRESGSIEHAADVVMFMYRDDKYHENSERPNQCDINIAKNRNGPLGMETLYFRKEYTQFTPMVKSKIDLREAFGTPTPQHWNAPPRRNGPIHIDENYHEADRDRENGDDGK